MKTKLPVALITILVSAIFVSGFTISLRSSGTPAFAVDKEPDLVGYWKFDEGSGAVAYDSSGNGNDGALVNNPQWVDGRVNKALSFDKARNDEVQISDSPTLRSPASTNQITIMAWAKLLADLNDYTATMVAKYPGYYLDWGNAGTNRPAFFLDWSDNTYSQMDGAAWPKYEWHHIAATYDGFTMRLYTDGLLERSASFGKQIASSTNYLGIGNADVQWFTGRIDEVKIYNSALTAYEIEAEVGNSWPMFRHDLRHTGCSVSRAPNTNNTLWTKYPGYTVSSFPAVANGRVYFGAGSTYPRTYAADAITGELIWNTTTGAGGSYSHSSVAVANGRVYVANYNRDVYALNETTGAIIWQFSLEGYTFNTSPAVANGIVYLGSEGYASGSSYVWALNATTGHIVWAYLTGPIYYSSPAVVDGVVYIGDISSGYSNVYALNASTGTKIWNFTRAGGAFYSSPAVAGGRLYIGSMDSNVYALNTTTGVKVWNHTTGNGIRSSPAVVGGVVYIGSQDKNIYALNASTGAKIWNYTATSLVHVSAPAVADGKVFIGSNDGNFFALNATTGAKIWRYKTLGMGYTQPAVAYGNVYTGGGPMGLIAFGGKQNLTVASTAGGTTNPLPGTYLYPTETYLSVSAIPNAGYRLDHWELDGINVGATNPVSFTLESDHTLSAVFVEVPVPPDIAITDVTPSKRIIGQGYNVSIEVTLTNQGNSPITSYVTGNPSFLTPSQWLTFWSMGDVDKNGYINRQDLGLINSAYWSTPSSMNWNPNADLNSDGLVNWTDLFICFFKQGRDIWSYFLLPHPLGPERVDLQPESSTSLTFVWNTENIKKANYTMGATVDPVSGEIDTADNTFTDGNVTVTTSGDINGDQNVNLVDLILLSTAYGATPADPNWNPEADINTDLIVDVIDLKILGKNYWQSTVTMKDPYDIFAAHNASCSHEMLVGLVSMEFLCSHTHSR